MSTLDHEAIVGFAFEGKVPFTPREFHDARVDNRAGNWTDEVKGAFGQMWHEERRPSSKMTPP